MKNKLVTIVNPAYKTGPQGFAPTQQLVDQSWSKIGIELSILI